MLGSLLTGGGNESEGVREKLGEWYFSEFIYQNIGCNLLGEWKRKWKLELIESINPSWEDLYHTII